MADNSEMLTRRNTLRLQGFDYTLPEVYFVTICCYNRLSLLGGIEDAKVKLSPIGRLVFDTWQAQPEFMPGLVLDAFVVMPNHMHVLFGFTSLTSSSGAKPISVPRVVQAVKSVTTIEAKKQGLLREVKLWQSGYYDHIVRGEASLESIQEYISTNPQRWHLDRENIGKTGSDEFDSWLEQEGRRAPKRAR